MLASATRNLESGLFGPVERGTEASVELRASSFELRDQDREVRIDVWSWEEAGGAHRGAGWAGDDDSGAASGQDVRHRDEQGPGIEGHRLRGGAGRDGRGDGSVGVWQDDVVELPFGVGRRR